LDSFFCPQKQDQIVYRSSFMQYVKRLFIGRARLLETPPPNAWL
jgi:hypothetical protein